MATERSRISEPFDPKTGNGTEDTRRGNARSTLVAIPEPETRYPIRQQANLTTIVNPQSPIQKSDALTRKSL